MTIILPNMLSTLFKYSVLILDFVLWVFILPVLLPVTVLFASYKCIVKVLLVVCYPNSNFIRANDLPVARGTLEDKPIVDIGFILEVNGNLKLEQLREKFTSCFLQTPQVPVKKTSPLYRLHCTFSSFMGYLCTTPVFFDISTQIRETTLNVPVKEYFASWFQSPYASDNLPRWELILAKSNESFETSYVGFRVHHGLMDGLGLMWILEQLCDIPSKPGMERKQRDSSVLLFYIRLLLALPRELIIFLSKGIKQSRMSGGKTLIPNINENESINNKKFLLSWSSGELSPFKTARRVFNVPFSTLLYTAQSAAVRMYLEDLHPNVPVPERVPVIHTIAKPNHPMTTLKNHWTLVKFYTPFAEKDVSVNLQQTTKEYQTFLERGLHISGPSFISEFMNIFPTKWCLYNVSSPLSTYQLALSNTIRSNVRYELLGKEVRDIHHVFCTKDLCPDAVLYTTTASQDDLLDATHSGSSLLFPTQKEMDMFASVYWPKAIQSLVEASHHYHKDCQDLSEVVTKR